jgi:hypothetical protein
MSNNTSINQHNDENLWVVVKENKLSLAEIRARMNRPEKPYIAALDALRQLNDPREKTSTPFQKLKVF